MNNGNKIKTGKLGEQMAYDFIIKNAYIILDRNFRAGRWGEIDLIARKNNIIHFIEVKTRNNNNFGWPEESVTPRKIKKIALAAEAYLYKNKLYNQWQIDIISILINRETKTARLWHIKNV